MKLNDCHARFLSDGNGNQGAGVQFDCPLCLGQGRAADPGPYCSGNVFVPFSNPIGDGPQNPNGWRRSGANLDNLTLTPSVLIKAGGCPWHGYVTNGAITSCP